MLRPNFGHLAGTLLALAGCGDAVLVVVAGDREVPTELDAICLGVADRDPGGGAFGRSYRLEGALASLPQSLAVEAGGADAAEAWVRGYQGGVEVAVDRAGVDFGGDVTLRLDRCAPGSSAAPIEEAAVGPADASIAASMGRGGWIVVAAGATAAIIDAEDTRELDLGGATGVVALDADGDCDDDLVAFGAAGAQLYVRDIDGFTPADAITTDAVVAAAAADVDRDGDADLVVSAGPTLYRSDGAGTFARDDAAIPSGVATDVSALALGDLDGDTNPDLIAGQDGAPPRAFLADASGQGVFTSAPAILPDVALAIRGFALADVDADADLDLGVAIAGAAPRLYVNRGGLLEDQSFVRLPQPAPAAAAIAAADWDGDCRPDLALAGATTALYAGGDDGAFSSDAEVGAATAAVFVDLDDDGARDLVLATASGVIWVHR